MTLSEYRRKRHFGKTAEPEPGDVPQRRRAIFVVQLHHASRRHYDFRLQVGDALKSWAVPKGPSYDPAVKRMAVEVEDHPLDYAGFEGEIPKGEYGGGHVARFDQGVWSSAHDVEAQLAKGHLQFELFGEKLKGGWHLVRSRKPAKQPQWLLFKHKDEFAGTLEADDLLGDVTAPPAADAKRAGSGKPWKRGAIAPPGPKSNDMSSLVRKLAKLAGAKKSTLKPEAFAPQLAKLGDSPPRGEKWIHELKWDGYRIVATIVDGRPKLWSRNAIEWTGKVPEITAALARLGVRAAALDGELIAGSGTQEDFNVLQATLSGARPGPLTLVLFDLLHLEGYSLEAVTLLERKELLAELLAERIPHLAYSTHIAGEGDAAFEIASDKHFEGIISKRADRPHHAGRSDDWRKTKRLESEEFAVVGYTLPQGSRKGFGSLLLARPDGDGGWSYAGRVGSGFSDELLRDLTRRIGKSGGPTPTATLSAAVAKELRGAVWFKPRFVVEAIQRGKGESGLLRQPSLKAVRLDKDVADLVAAAAGRSGADGGEDLKPAARRKPAPAKPRANSNAVERGRKAPASKRKGSDADARAELARVSSPGKVIFAEKGYTKQDVANYYMSVMEHLLPEIAGRPLSVIRCPNGAGKACFFQKHHTAGLDKVDLVPLKEEGGHNANYLVVRDAAGVMELVQFNALEFHPWGSTAERPDHANRVVFDLDPGPDVPWSKVKSAAIHVRDLLAQLELKSFLRTSGGKGLHVVVPLNPGCEWGLVKDFARGFADAMAQSEPDRYLSVSTLKLRPGKIFVDYLRNGRGATSVASFSLRARVGAPVAVPLAWSELAALKRSDAFDIVDVPVRLRRQRKEPWAGIDAIAQDLSRWSRD